MADTESIFPSEYFNVHDVDFYAAAIKIIIQWRFTVIISRFIPPVLYLILFSSDSVHYLVRMLNNSD